MKKKIILRVTLLTLIALFAIISFVKLNTYIYIGNFSSSYDGAGIDIQVKIDGHLALDDSLYYSPFECIIQKRKLSSGFHKISVSTKKANIIEEKEIFLFPNQYILIEFYPGMQNKTKKPELIIVNHFNPFFLR